jgi:hypothetical protein
MKVYVVMHGENYQGGSLQDIFSNRREAVKFATEFAKTMPFSMTKKKDRDVWTGGCDWLSVDERPVSNSAEEALEEINN